VAPTQAPVAAEAAEGGGARPPVTVTRGEPTMPTVAMVELARMSCGGGEGEACDRVLSDMQDRADDFAGPDPTPAMRALGDVAALDWHLCLWLQFQLSARGGDALALEARLDRANRRLNRTLKTLAQLRRLVLPPMQVNIANGGHQLNQLNLRTDAPRSPANAHLAPGEAT
jgi:hypothetical protein